VAVIEQDGFAATEQGRDVEGGGDVTHDFEVGRCVGHQGVVAPDQVLAHEAAREVVGGGDWYASRTDPAFVADPAVALGDGPLVQPDGVGRRRPVALGGGVKGKLPAGVVEHQ